MKVGREVMPCRSHLAQGPEGTFKALQVCLSWWRACLARTRPPGLILSMKNLGLGEHTCNPHTWMVKERAAKVQGYPQLCSKLQASPSYTDPVYWLVLYHLDTS